MGNVLTSLSGEEIREIHQQTGCEYTSILKLYLISSRSLGQSNQAALFEILSFG